MMGGLAGKSGVAARLVAVTGQKIIAGHLVTSCSKTITPRNAR
jgi:hypothetical protein